MSVLVIGAAGRVGRLVVDALVARDAEPVAFARDPDAPVPAGVPVAVGDLAEPDTVRKAIDGCTAVLLRTPPSPEQVLWENGVVDAAADVGARVVTVSSAAPVVQADSPLCGARRHWITQQYIVKRQLPHTFLQPNLLAQPLMERYAGQIRATGRLPDPAAGRGVSLLDARDLAEVAAECLVSADHDGHTYVLTGPSAPTHFAIARLVSALTGRRVDLAGVPEEQVGQWVADQGWTAAECDHLTEVLRLYRTGTGEVVTDDVEWVTGRPARGIAELLAERRADF